MARMWIGTLRRWGLGALLSVTLAACGPGGLVPPTPTEPPRTGPLGLAADPLVTIGQLQARAILTYGQNGWVHIIETVTHDLDREIFTTLPNGTPVPLDHVIETWAHITGAQVITQRVIYVRAGDGQVLETSVYDQGVAWNSSTGEREKQTDTPVGAFDRGFGASMGEYQRVGATVTQAAATLDGIEVIELQVDYTFDAPAQYGDYTQPVTGQRIRADFDPNGGQLRRLDWVMRLADGSERNYGRWEVTLEAGVTPPDEVLTALEVLK